MTDRLIIDSLKILRKQADGVADSGKAKQYANKKKDDESQVAKPVISNLLQGIFQFG